MDQRSSSFGMPSHASRKVSGHISWFWWIFVHIFGGFSCLDSLFVLVAAHASLDKYVATWFGFG